MAILTTGIKIYFNDVLGQTFGEGDKTTNKE